MADEEAVKTAKLPESYRKQHPTPKRVRDLTIREAIRIAKTGVRIDGSWGVWIDPEAVSVENGPIGVKRYEDAYIIFLNDGKWNREVAVREFAGFISVGGLR